MKFSKIISFSQMLVPGSLVVNLGILCVLMIVINVFFEVKGLLSLI